MRTEWGGAGWLARLFFLLASKLKERVIFFLSFFDLFTSFAVSFFKGEKKTIAPRPPVSSALFLSPRRDCRRALAFHLSRFPADRRAEKQRGGSGEREKEEGPTRFDHRFDLLRTAVDWKKTSTRKKRKRKEKNPSSPPHLIAMPLSVDWLPPATAAAARAKDNSTFEAAALAFVAEWETNNGRGGKGSSSSSSAPLPPYERALETLPWVPIFNK
jgi:hypothetical protein